MAAATLLLIRQCGGLDGKTRRYVSPRRSFEARDGELVSDARHAARIWPLMLAALAKPDLWISLERA